MRVHRYPELELLRAKLQATEGTKMLDASLNTAKRIMELEKGAGIDGANASLESRQKKYAEQRKAVVQEYKAAEALTNDLQDSLPENVDDASALEKFKADKKVTGDTLGALFKNSRFYFDTGNYEKSIDCLVLFDILGGYDGGSQAERGFLARWGRLAAEICLLGFGEEAAYADDDVKEALTSLNSAIDARGPVRGQVSQLLQRCWVANWSLFVYFSVEKVSEGASSLVKFLTRDTTLAAIQLKTPWILRYLVAAAIIMYDEDKTYMYQITDIVESERDNYRDPVTEFFYAIQFSYDFEASRTHLIECEKMLKADYFLGRRPEIRDRFLMNARRMVFELYSRTHKRIRISTLVRTLNLDQKDPEKALVELIRTSPFPVKVDTKEGIVTMKTRYPSIHQKVIEKTRVLFTKSVNISEGIDRRAAAIQARKDAEVAAAAGAKQMGAAGSK